MLYAILAVILSILFDKAMNIVYPIRFIYSSYFLFAAIRPVTTAAIAQDNASGIPENHYLPNKFILHSDSFVFKISF